MITLDIITLVAMLATFIVLLVKFKTPSGIALMAASVVGLAVGCLIHIKDGLPFDPRYLIEGGFGYIDNLLVILCAMILIKGLEHNGGLDYITVTLVRAFKKFPTVLLLVFMALLLLPGMVTGSSTAAVVSIGIIILPVLIKMGMPKAKAAAFVGFGAILGMVAPPINIPVMVICDVVDLAYSGFDGPLLLLTVPMAIIGTMFFSRDVDLKKVLKKDNREINFIENIIISALFVIGAIAFVLLYVNKIGVAKETNLVGLNKDNFLRPYKCYMIYMFIAAAIGIAITWLFKPYSHQLKIEEIKETMNFNIYNEVNWTCIIPLIVIVVLFAFQSIFPKQVGKLGTPLLFVLAAIPTAFTGKKCNPVKIFDEAVERSLGVFGLLMGVGMFVEILTVTGARGLIVANILTILTISTILLFIAMGGSLSIFGGISSFASASVFGGPFVMAMGNYSYIIVASACSLIASLGEFLPPTAMSSRLATKNVNDIKDAKEEDLSFSATTKSAIFPLALTLVWAILFVISSQTKLK